MSTLTPKPSSAVNPLEPAEQRQARLRQAANPLRHIHHHAYRCRDAEETRHFYEDILKMPLVAAVMMPEHPVTHAPNPFCHIFFEMGDGNCIAFFDYPAELKDRTFEPETGFDHHLAIEVEGDEVIEEFRKQLEAAGVPHHYIDHGVFHSMYFNDPNGLNLELVTKVPATYANDLDAARTARENLKKWTATRR